MRYVLSLWFVYSSRKKKMGFNLLEDERKKYSSYAQMLITRYSEKKVCFFFLICIMDLWLVVGADFFFFFNKQ